MQDVTFMFYDSDDPSQSQEDLRYKVSQQIMTVGSMN